MPIEIRELVIKATVNNQNVQTGGSSDGSGNSEALINEIVERVFAILQQKSKR